AERLAQLAGSLGEAAALQQEAAKLVAGGAVARTELHRAPQVADRRVRLPAFGQRGAQVPVRVDGIGAALQRVAERVGRVGISSFAQEQDAEDVVNRVGVGDDRAE